MDGVIGSDFDLFFWLPQLFDVWSDWPREL